MLRIGRTLAGVHLRCGAHPAGRSLHVAADNSVAPQLFKVGGCEPAAQHLRGDLIKRTALRSARHVKRRRTRGSTPVLAATTRLGAGHPRPVACTRGARASSDCQRLVRNWFWFEFRACPEETAVGGQRDTPPWPWRQRGSACAPNSA